MMSTLKPAAEQVAVIMGASSGIGRATALKMAGEGARLVVSARGEEGLNSLVEEIEAAGGEATAITADVTNFEQVRAVAEEAVRRYGRLDTWVHLAAVSIYARFEDTTPEEFKQVIDVNLVGQAHGILAALPHLRREGRGALILVSSVEAMRALPLQSAYAASKHGVKALAETVRMELQHEGLDISVTNIMPASINTPFFDKARTKIGVKPKGIPPIYEPEVVADAIVHAAQHPQRDVFAGGAGRGLILLQQVAPGLLDFVLVRTGFKGQRTDEPKSAQAPDNLYETLDTHDRVHGDFGEQALPFSAYNSLQQMDGKTLGLAGVLLGAGLALFLRREREQQPAWQRHVSGALRRVDG